MLPGYSKELEKQMQELYRRLSEKTNGSMQPLKPLNFRMEASVLLPAYLAAHAIRSELESKSWVRKMNCQAIGIERPVAVESQRWLVMRLLMNYSWLFCKTIRQAIP